MMHKILLTFLLVFCAAIYTNATHVVGGALEYERIGTGSLPNSSRYKIKLKLWRDAAGNPWFPTNPLIECRGDTLGYTLAGFDPYVATYPGGNIYPYSGLDRMNDFSAGSGISRQFIRDFTIACASPLDTLTVRTGAFNTTVKNNNTKLAPTTGVPGYENPSYVRSGYPTKQYLQDGYGFAIGVCDATGNSLGANNDRTNYTDACDANQTSPYGRLCVPQYVDSCTFVPKVFIQYAVYIRVVDLPNIPGGYHIKFNLSARNNAIVNLNNPGGTSFTVYARIPDIAQLDGSAGSFTNITTLTSSLVTTVTSVLSFSGTSASNKTATSTFTGIVSTNTIPGVFLTAYTNLGIPGVTAINANIITTNRVLVTSIAGAITTITSRIVSTSILGITTTGFTANSLAYPQVSSITGLDVQISGVNTITAPYLNPTDNIRNSSPRFKSVPPLFVCQYNTYVASLGINQNPQFDHSAFDADGDSIQYNLVIPNDGSDGGTGPAKTDEMFVGYWKSATSANINGTIFTTGMPLYATTLAGFPYPENVNLATFNPVSFKSPFTDQLPLGNTVVGSITTPGIVLNSSTGAMDIKPLVPPGLYVVSVRAREFRRPSGTVTGLRFLGDITRDYQFRVLSCPLPAQAYIGASIDPLGINVCKGVPTVFSPPNNSTAAAFATGAFYWDSGKDRFVNSFGGPNLYPVRLASSNNLMVTTPLGINEKNGNPASFSYSVAGTYYTKLVVQDRGTKCADSVFAAINISNVKSGWFQTPRGPICVNKAIVFDPYQPTTIGGFVSVSGSSLWTDPSTNLIPRVSVSGFTGVSATYPGIATSVNGTAMSLTNYTGYIDFLWMQPDGVSRKRIPPPVAAPAKIVFMTWNLGNGNIQSLTLAGSNWISYGPIVPGLTITGANSIPNTFGGINLSLPGINYPYPSAGNFKVTLTVYNQFGCSDSLQRNITIIQQQPMATGIGGDVCVNNAVISVTGNITIAAGGIWSGGLGTYLPSVTQAGSSFVMQYKPSAAELVPGTVVGLKLSTYGNGVCPIGNSTVIAINIKDKPHVLAGPAATVCGNNMQYLLNGIVTGVGSNISVNGGNFQAYWQSKGTGKFVGSGTVIGSNTTISNNTTSGSVVDTYMFSKADSLAGSVKLLLIAANTGICKSISDSIVLTMLPAAQLPTVTPGNNQLVCANNSKVVLNGSVTNSPLGGIWTTMGNGTFAGFNTSTNTITGPNAFYTPSKSDSAAGSVKLFLSTNITSVNGGCFNASKSITVTIGPSPTIIFGAIPSACVNNPITNLVATIVGSTGVLWSGSGIPSSFGGGTYNPGNNSPNIVSIGSGVFQSSLTYTALNSETTSPGIKFINISTTGNGICSPVTAQSALNYQPAQVVSILGPASVSVCKNNTSYSFTTKITNFNVGATIGQWSTSGSGTFSPGVVLTTNSAVFTYTPSSADTASGNVRLIIAVSSNDGKGYNCKISYDTLNIAYTNLPTVDPGPNQTICENNLIAKLSGSVTSPATGGIWSTNGTGSFTSVSSGNFTSTILGDNYFPSATDRSNGSVKLTLTTTGPNIGSGTGQCAAIAKSITINFSSVPTIQFGTVPQVCENNPSVFLTATIVGQSPGQNITATTMGTWGKGAGNYVPGVNNFNLVSSPSLGLVSSGSVTYTPDAFELASKVVNMAVTATGIGNCNAISAPLTFNISPKPTVDITTPNPTVCGNNAHAILNAVISGANGGTWSGGLNPVLSTQTGNNFVATYDPNSTEINNGNAKLYLTTNGVLNNCNPVVDSTLITITKAPIVSTGGNILVCIAGANQVTITGTVANAGGGVWNTSGTGTFLATNTSSVSINGGNMTTVYVPSASDKNAVPPLPLIHISLTSTNNGNCLAVSDEITMGFGVSPTADAGPDQVVCINDFPIQLNATGVNGGSWSSSRNDGTFGNVNQLSTTYTPPTTIPGGTVITLTWTPDPAGLCSGIPNAMLVTVLSAPVYNIISANTVCGGAGFFPISVNGSGFSGGTWKAVSGVFSTTGANSSLNIPDAYKPSIADIALGSVTLSFTGGNTFPCTAKPNTKTIKIDPPITIDPGPGPQTLCDNVTSISLTGQVFINSVPTTTGVNVLWNKLSTVAGLYGGGNPTSTLYSPVFTPTLADKTSGSIILLMSTPGLGTCSSPGTSSVIYNFQKSPTATILGIPAVVCSDTSYVQLSGTFTGSAGMVWSTTGTGSFSPDNTNMNAKYILSIGDKTVSGITFKILNVGSGLCTNSASSTQTVTIVGKPIVDAGPDLTICGNNTAITLTGANTTTTGISSVTGIWYLSNTVAPVGSFTGGNSIPVNGVGTLPVYFPSSKEILVDQIVTVFVSVSGVGIAGYPNVCPGQNDKRIFTFTPAPVVTAGANQLLCGDATSNVLTLTGTTTIANSGRWTANQGIGSIVSINGLSAKYLVNAADKSSLSTTLGFTFTVTFPGSTASVIGCVNVSTTTSVTLTSVPGVSITGGNQTICGDALFTNPLNGISSTGFGTWSTTTPGTFSPNSSTLTGAKFAPLLTEMVSAYTTGKPIKIKLNSALNGVCTAKSDSIFVTVTTPPAITAGSDTSVCTDVGTVPLYGAVITVSSGMIWSTSSSQGRFVNTGTITSQGITTTGPNALIRNIIVQDYIPGAAERNAGSVVLTARSTLSGTCANVFAVKNITFIKEPTVTVGVNQSVCSNNSVVNCNAVVTNAVKIRWIQIGGNGNFLDPTAASTQYFPGKQDSITTTFGNVVSITCSVIGNNLCQAKTATFALKVTPAPVVKTIGTISICSDTSGVQFSGITLPTLTTVGVQWANYTNPASTASNFSPSKFVLNPKYIPSSADIASGTVKLLVSTTGNGGCIAGSDTLKVLIQPKPIITAGPDQNLCSDFGGSIKLTFTGTNFSSGSTGSWSSSGDGNFGSPFQNTVTGIGNDPTYYNVSPGDFSRGRVTIQVSSQEGLCRAVNAKVNVTFTGAPVVSAGNTQTNCYIVGKVLTLTGSVVGTETYKYTWFHTTHASTLSGVFANGNDTLSSVATVVGTTGIEKYTTGAGDGARETFNFLVTGTGICRNQYSSSVDLINKKPIDLGITAPLTICSDIASFDVSVYDKRTGFGSDPTFSTTTGDGLVWSAKNNNGQVANFSQFSPGIFSTSTFTYTPSNTGANPDRSSTLIGFTFTSTGSSICPSDIVTANVIVTPAPTVSTLAGLSACSNNQTVSLTGIASNFTSVQWISSSAFPGTFTGANSLLGTYTPSANEISNGIANLVLTASKFGCTDVSVPLAIAIKQAPVVNAGAPGSVCSLTGITVTGTIQPPLSVVLGSLWGVDGASPGSGTPGIQVITTTPGIMSVQNTFSTLTGGPFITLRLTANEPSCASVSSTVTYTFVGTPVLDPGPPRTQCASDVIQLTPGAASAMGIWTTSGQGVFASTNTSITSNMNDIYLPSAGEILNGTILGFTLVGQPSSCGTPVNVSVNYTITSGMSVKADSKKVVSVCTNASPSFTGTISGSSMGVWTSNGSGTFANGGNIVSGTLVGTKFVFQDTYTPSDADKSAGRVVLRLTAVPDGINSLCSNNAFDTLSLFFTAPPTVNANGDKRVCANVAVTTIAGGGVSISGSAFLPSPNSTDPNATPVNAARWRWLSSVSTPGYFMSTNTTTGQVISFSGTALNITINLSEVYIPSYGEAFSTNSPVKLVLESFYVGSIVGGATCVPAIDTIDVNFNPAPSANIIFTGTGICTDIDQFNLYGNIAQALGGVWSTSGTGSLLPDNVWNSPSVPTTYKLSASEATTTSPINVKFTLETTNNPGCYSTISSVLTVTINPRPVVTIAGAQIICADLTTITLTGGSATAFAGAFPANYTWITNGTGSISGLNSAAGANMPGLYTLNQSDISFGSLLFTLSTSGPNTCKPVTMNMDVTITPAPSISLTSRQELCRDSDTMTVTAAINVATGVTWTVKRCLGSVCGVNATGTFFTGTGTSLTGVFLPSAADLLAANTDSLEFTAVTTGNNTSGSFPSCNSVMARTYIKLTPKPTVSITSIPGICADLTSINLMGVVSVAGGGKWASTGGGTFFSEFSLPSVAYELSDIEKSFIFPTTVGISLTSDANGTCKPVVANFTLSITGSPKVETGPDRNVCADSKSIDLSAAVATLTGGGFAWNTFGTGTFTGTSSTFTGITTLPGSWTYAPSASDSANGAVILVLTTTGPNPCNPVESYITIKFDRTPNVIISAGVDQVVCADNPLINLDGRTNGQNPSWHAFKDPTIPGNSTVNGMGGNGVFSPDTTTLNASYFPSVQDTTGATSTFTNQILRIRLRAYGTGSCSSQIYESNMNVTFTPLPRVDVLISPSSICTNDQSPITLSGNFLNNIAGGGAWTSSGSANSALPFASVVNPPSITGIVYQPTAADKINGSGGGNSEISGRVGFTFTTQAQGTCRAISKSIPLIIYKAPSINPGTDKAICETQTLVSVSGITTGVLTGRWRSSGSGQFLNGTNPGANMATVTGGKINDSYTPTAADIAAGSINLFLTSRTQSNNCPSDSAKIALSFDLVPIVNTGLTQTICAEPGLVSLTGTVLNATTGIWSVSTPGSGSFNPGSDTVNTVYKLSENDKNLSPLVFTLTSNSSTSKCPQVSSAPLIININKVPIASIDYTYLCTSTGLQLFGGINNSLFGTWTTSGTGIFTPTPAPVPFVTGGTQYFPSDPDIAGGVTITLEAHGLGACPSSKSQITPNLSAHPSPYADAGMDATICTGNKYELNVPGLNDLIKASYTYQWLKPSITGISTVLSAIANVNITDVTVYADTREGDSLYVLKVTDNINKCSSLDTVKIKAISPVDLGLIPSICYEDDLILPTMPVTITGGTYQWYIDGQISQQNKNPNRIKANDPGSYTLQFTQFGCQSYATTQVKGRVILQTKGKVTCYDQETSLTPNILPYVQNTLIVVTLTGGTTVLGVRRDTLHPDYVYKWYYQYNKLAPNFLGDSAGDYARNDTIITYNFDGSILNRGKYTRDTITVRVDQDSAKYVVGVSAFGCETIDTVRVKTHPVPKMQLVDVPACIGDLVQLEGRPSNMESPKTFEYPPSNRRDTIWSSIKWNTFPSGLIQPPTDTVHKITVTASGTYFVKYQIGECIGLDTSKVDFNFLPTVTNLSMVKYCPEGGKGITLDAGYGNGYHYLWLASGKESQYEIVYDTLKYYFKVFTNHNCSVLDSITVNASCEPRIFTPDAFIPDGADDNKYFRVYGKNFINFNIRIYNRWGEVIFSSHDKDFGWDGTYQGSKMPTGVYPYIITYDGQYEDYRKQKLERGKVTLVR